MSGMRALARAYTIKHRRDSALRCRAASAIFSFVRGYSNQTAELERAQQHGADEREYREHGQHIEPQSKIHDTSPVVVDWTKV
jgi:hypothetical protein